MLRLARTSSCRRPTGRPASAVAVIARALPQDDVIVETQDAVALVHLTWTGKPEPLPWPMTEWIDSAEQLAELIEFKY